MSVCWQCKTPLRQSDSQFCPHCGATQRADNATSAEWQARIQEHGKGSGVGGKALLVLACLLGPLGFPVCLARAARGLRQHIAERAAAPALSTPRFTESTEGQTIARQLAGGKAKGATGLFLILLTLYGVLAVVLGVIFIVPAQAPVSISYESALGSLMDIRPAYRYSMPVTSERDYEDSCARLQEQGYTRLSISDTRLSGSASAAKSSTPPPVWNYWGSETPATHRPYLYLTSPNSTDLWRVASLSAYWDGTETAGVVMVIGLILLHLLFAGYGLWFWRSFMRHQTAEVLAACYARGDLATHDRLLPRLRRRHRVAMGALAILALTPFHSVLFPLVAAVAFARHRRWEQRNAIPAALGVVQAE